MRKFYFVIAILLAGIHVQAQYKKATFLNKSGRTYDVGFAGHFIPDGGGVVPGILFSYGRDRGRRIFHWFDVELLLPTNYTYKTVDKDFPQQSLTVNGKSNLGLVWRYNFAGYLTNIENTDAKFKPFAVVGLNFLLAGGASNGYSVSPESSYPEKVVLSSVFSYGANIGLGSTFNMTEKIGLKLTAGYNYQNQVALDEYYASDGYKAYVVYPSHPYVTFGVRFTMVGDGD